MLESESSVEVLGSTQQSEWPEATLAFTRRRKCSLWVHIYVIALVSFLTETADLFILYPIADVIRYDWHILGWSRNFVSLFFIYGARFFGLAFSGWVLFPILSRFVGRRPILLVSQFINIVTTALMAFCTNPFLLVGLRLFSGFGSTLRILPWIILGEDRRIPRRWRGLAISLIPASEYGLSFLLSLVLLTARIEKPYSGLTMTGMLNRPVSHSSWFFRQFGSLFAPSLICCLLNVVGFVLSLRFSLETEHSTVIAGTSEEVRSYKKYLELVREDDTKYLAIEDRKRNHKAEKRRGVIVDLRAVQALPFCERVREIFRSEVCQFTPWLCFLIHLLLLAGNAMLLQTPTMIRKIQLMDRDDPNGRWVFVSVFAVLMGVRFGGALSAAVLRVFDRFSPVWFLRLFPFLVGILLLLTVMIPDMTPNRVVGTVLAIVFSVFSQLLFGVLMTSIYIVETHSVTLASKELLGIASNAIHVLSGAVWTIVLAYFFSMDSETGWEENMISRGVLGGLTFLGLLIASGLSFFLSTKLRYPVPEPLIDPENMIVD